MKINMSSTNFQQYPHQLCMTAPSCPSGKMEMNLFYLNNKIKTKSFLKSLHLSVVSFIHSHLANLQIIAFSLESHSSFQHQFVSQVRQQGLTFQSQRPSCRQVCICFVEAGAMYTGITANICSIYSQEFYSQSKRAMSNYVSFNTEILKEDCP